MDNKLLPLWLKSKIQDSGTTTWLWGIFSVCAVTTRKLSFNSFSINHHTQVWFDMNNSLNQEKGILEHMLEWRLWDFKNEWMNECFNFDSVLHKLHIRECWLYFLYLDQSLCLPDTVTEPTFLFRHPAQRGCLILGWWLQTLWANGFLN